MQTALLTILSRSILRLICFALRFKSISLLLHLLQTFFQRRLDIYATLIWTVFYSILTLRPHQCQLLFQLILTDGMQSHIDAHSHDNHTRRLANLQESLQVDCKHRLARYAGVHFKVRGTISTQATLLGIGTAIWISAVHTFFDWNKRKEINLSLMC